MSTTLPAGATTNAHANAHANAHLQGRLRRIAFTHWLRKTHGYFGLWGATLGLLFGTSGIWLNHRAVLQLPPMGMTRSSTELALPDPAPANAQALAVWLQGQLGLDRPATQIKVEPARPVAWAAKGDKNALTQPEHWTIAFNGPHASVQAETWAGNRSASVRRVDNGFIATLTNLHKGSGMPVAWILLVDTLAGSLILLSLSGLALWVMTKRRRALGLAIYGTALVVTVGLALSRW